MNYETFEELINLMKFAYEECRNFNKSLEQVFGEDSTVCYYKQYDIIVDHIIKILVINGESHDGAEWFVYDGLEQIEKGGTEIGYDDKWYNIKTIRDYYDWLMNLKKETK